MLEKTLKSPLDSKEIRAVNPKGNQPWLFIGRTDAEALILWLPNAKSQLTGKYPDAGKDWRVEGKGATEDELVGCHHWLNGHEFDKLQEIVKDREAWHTVVHAVTKSWMQLSNWTITKTYPAQMLFLPVYREASNCSFSPLELKLINMLNAFLVSSALNSACSSHHFGH